MTIVSGYLGAGKTTLINRIISGALAERLCVIVNDFGDLSVDAELLRGGTGHVLTLANGCVCCSAASGLYAALETALETAPERILIETSGVADPARIAAVASAEPDLDNGGVFTVVDCTTFAGDIGDALKGPDILRQVRAANAILLSRCDVVGTDAVADARALVSVLAPGAVVSRGDRVATLPHLAELRGRGSAGDDLVERRAEDRYAWSSIRCGEISDLEGFIAAVRAIRPPPMRLKGLLRLPGEAAPVLLNFEHGRAHSKPVTLAAPLSHSVITAVFARAGGAPNLESLVQDQRGR